MERKRHNFMSHSVTYNRGVASVAVLATTGKTDFEQTDEYGVVHRFESRDFLIAAADLVISEVEITPRSGDRIEEEQSGATVTYEALTAGPLPPYEYSDSQRLTYRVHTKQVA